MAITHIARVIRVQADVINTVTPTTGGYTLALAGGASFFASTAMTLIHMPVATDYLVTQEDGFQYLAAKSVFDHQYVVAPPAIDVDPAVDTSNHRVRLTGQFLEQ